ncbi:hypothetical protein [Photobacterium leiognathi]|uniref:hypothetical protein n=1 Tax=Photobacterium leiognathi TaxID=553611 RepID=UPI00298247C3|nr:hypothetical protein [Photobacterium leiognathi]
MINNKYNSFILQCWNNILPIAFSLVLLNGCNSEKKSVGMIDDNHAQIITPRTFVYTQPDVQTSLNIDTIYAGRNLKVNNIVSNDVNCQASISFSQNQVFMQSSAGMYCRYTLNVSSDGQRQASHSEVYTFASLSERPLIDMIIAEVDEYGKVDLVKAFGEQWPTGYKLSQVLSVDGPDVNLSDIQLEGNQLKLNLDYSDNVTAVRYLLENESLSNEPKTGIVVITNGNKNNTPIISNTSYDLTIEAGIEPEMFEEISIDLTKLPNYTIEVPTDWQLSYLYSSRSNVDVLNKEDVSNKAFTFVANTPGSHKINYIIQNHWGDMAAGYFTVNVLPAEKAKTWGSVQTKNDKNKSIKIFPGPLLFSSVQPLTNTVPLWDAKVANTLAGFRNIDAAETICAAKGRIPFAYELEAVYQAGVAGDLDLSSWPKSTPYLVYSADKSKALAYELNTGTLREKVSDNEVLNMTCMEFQELLIQSTNITIPVNKKESVAILTKSSVESEYDFSVVSDVLDDSNVVFESENIGTSGRRVVIYATANKGGKFKIKVQDKNDAYTSVESRILAAVGNWKELQFSDEVTFSKPYLLANNREILDVGIRMIDDDGNGIHDKGFALKTALTTLSYPWSDWTDLEGYTSFKVKASENIIPEGKYEVIIPATVSKDAAEKIIDIPVYSKNYFHTITPIKIAEPNRFDDYIIEVNDDEGNPSSEPITLENTNNQTHVMLSKDSNGEYQVNLGYATPIEGRAELKMLPIEPFKDMASEPAWAPTTDYLNMHHRLPEKKVGIEMRRMENWRMLYVSGWDRTLDESFFNEKFGHGYDQIIIQNRSYYHFVRWMHIPDLTSDDVGKTIVITNWPSQRVSLDYTYNNGEKYYQYGTDQKIIVFVWVGTSWKLTAYPF